MWSIKYPNYNERMKAISRATNMWFVNGLKHMELV